MKPFRARPRHPVTGARFTLSARSAAELGAYVHRLEQLRIDLRLGLKTPEQVDHELRFMKHGPVTLERVYRAYLERPDVAPETRRALATWWTAYATATLRAGPLAAIDAPAVRRWVEELARAGLAKSTIDGAWRKLSALGTYAAARGWIAGPPWGKARPPKVGGPGRPPREALRSVDELVRLLRAARALDAEMPTRWLAIKVFLAVLFGLRQGELAGLRWSDIEWGPPLVITVARQWEGQPLKRGTKVTRLEGLDAMVSILTIHKLEVISRGLYKDRGPLIPHPSSEPGAPRAYSKGEVLTRGDVRAVVDRASLRRADVANDLFGSWSAHSFRSSFVTLETLASGGDLRRVQARSRHASLASLVRYLRMLSETAPASPLVAELPGLVTGDAGAPLHTRRELPAGPGGGRSAAGSALDARPEGALPWRVPLARPRQT